MLTPVAPPAGCSETDAMILHHVTSLLTIIKALHCFQKAIQITVTEA